MLLPVLVLVLVVLMLVVLLLLPLLTRAPPPIRSPARYITQDTEADSSA